ncbi:MAG TPA: hypothetical protein VFQ61_37750, partial [Polyangiaceae bacterium]|nr:hypothetical protein [Polyangiaceae bacterium]
YCGIDQENVRCEAVLDMTTRAQECPSGDDDACGCERDESGACTSSGQGGLCRDLALVKNRCTYRCGSPDDCPTGKKCDGTPIAYCQ